MNREAIEYYKSISTIMENFCRPLNDYLGVSLFIYFKAFKISLVACASSWSPSKKLNRNSDHSGQKIGHYSST